MKAMVVYDSQFGNTGQIAQAIGRGLDVTAGSPDKIDVRQVAEVGPDALASLDVLVVGSPTQKFRPTSDTKTFLKNIPKGALKGVRVAAFDTRLTEEEVNSNGVLSKLVGIFGYAAQPISDSLAKKGGDVVMPPEGFYVTGTEGPLVEVELERAAAWGRQIAGQRL